MSYTLTQLLADQQTLRKAPEPLVTPVVPLKACWLNRTEISCCFSHLSAVTDRGEFDESLIPGFPPLLGVGTVDICCEQPTGMGRDALEVACSQTSSQTGMSNTDIKLN